MAAVLGVVLDSCRRSQRWMVTVWYAKTDRLTESLSHSHVLEWSQGA